jgi:hypothetical protein
VTSRDAVTRLLSLLKQRRSVRAVLVAVCVLEAGEGQCQ